MKSEYENGFIAGIAQEKETQMNLSKYNGWTNRETWLVNVWFNPECAGDVLWAKEQIEEEYESLPPFMRDFVNLDKINWLELQEHFEDEETAEE